MDIGIFSQAVFSPTVYDCGDIGRAHQWEDDDRHMLRHFNKLRRDDDDILEFIMTATTSGLLET